MTVMCVPDDDDEDRALLDTHDWFGSTMALQSELTRVRHVISAYLADPANASAYVALKAEAAPAPRQRAA